MAHDIATAGVKEERKLTLFVSLCIATAAMAIPLLLGYYYMTSQLNVKPSAAAGIVAFSLAFATIPGSLGFYSGLKNRRGSKRIAMVLESTTSRRWLPLGIVLFASVLSLLLCVWAMYKMSNGETREAAVLLIAASAVSLPLTVSLLTKMRKAKQPVAKEPFSSDNKSLFWQAITLVLISHSGLAAWLYGLYLLVQDGSTTSGVLCVMLGFVAYVILHSRSSEVDQALLGRESTN